MLIKIFDWVIQFRLFFWVSIVLAGLYVIAVFQSRNFIITLPWLVLAAISYGLSLMSSDNFVGVVYFLKKSCWDDIVARWLILGALVISVLGGIVLVGLGGAVPISITQILFNLRHPITAMREIFGNSKTLTGDNVWPFFVISGLTWPWWTPASWIFLRQTLSEPGGMRQWLLVLAISLICQITQSLVFSFQFFGRNIFYK